MEEVREGVMVATVMYNIPSNKVDKQEKLFTIERLRDIRNYSEPVFNFGLSRWLESPALNGVT